MTTRILVIDDDPIFQAIAGENLARAGFEVASAGDGVLALEMLTSEDFDLSIVDLSMPRLDGFRLLALIRATPKLTHHPLLVATSRKDVKAIDEAFALGANAF